MKRPCIAGHFRVVLSKTDQKEGSYHYICDKCVKCSLHLDPIVDVAIGILLSFFES